MTQPNRLLVVGDSMLDRYWEGSVERISPEAPVPVLRMSREWQRAGGAPLAALALNADGVTLTALANDYGYDAVFARQVEANARPGDCVVALSTSGRSPNVLRALEAAQQLGLARIAMLGRDGGAARALAQHAVVVPHEDSGRIQEAHIFIGHTWCGLVERALGLVS